MLVRALCAVCLLATAGQVLAEERFLIEMELWLHGEKHGTPMVIVPAGETASVSQTDENGESGWRVELEVENPGPQEGAPSRAVWLHIGVHQLVEGEWDHLADSILGVPEGETATLSVVDGDLDEPGPHNSSVYLTTRTSRVRENQSPEG